MNMNSTKQWIQQNSQTLKKVGIIVAVVLGIILIFVGLNSLIDIVHDWNYNRQQNNYNKQATQSETNANLHEANANTAANNIKELEKDENIIKSKQTEQNTKVSAAANKSTSTRENLNRALNQTVPNRAGDDGTDDDQLRTDSATAERAINSARIKKAATSKP